MKRNLLLFCIVLAISSALININALSAKYFDYGNNDTIVYAGDMKSDEISIFPNPVVGNMITVTSQTDFIEIEILNIVGRAVLQKRFMPGTTKAAFNLQHLNKGLYIIRVKFENRNLFTEKLMIK